MYSEIAIVIFLVYGANTVHANCWQLTANLPFFYKLEILMLSILFTIMIIVCKDIYTNYDSQCG